MGGSVLTVVGLGPGDDRYLSRETIAALQATERRWLRTVRHPAAGWLRDSGLVFASCDDLYERYDDFDRVYQAIVERLLEGLAAGPLVYAVPGSPLVAEATVRLLTERLPPGRLRILPAMSFLDLCYQRLAIDPLACQLTILDGLAVNSWPAGLGNCLITQVHSRMVASEVKLALANYVGDEQVVTVLRRLGTSGERVGQCRVFELDRLTDIDHLTTVYLAAGPDCQHWRRSARPLVGIMAGLRAEDGCPWDRQQTHRSLGRYLIEECYEVLAAIDSGDQKNLCEELGDLLLQIVFHARIAEENGHFSFDDVVRAICDKMVRRHPHVFAGGEAGDAAAVLANWERIKQQEKPPGGSRLDGVWPGLPALLRALKLQEKAADAGFDWPDWQSAWPKIGEEMQELIGELAGENPDSEAVTAEVGDLLFAVVNVARKLGVEPELALQAANRRFARRFAEVERQVAGRGGRWGDFSLAELDQFWEMAKCREAEKIVFEVDSD
ncbi:MAG: nucleoside triphosphate pyrophosphohydrolase [Negativicutes bacterium]|nr:nucleoside triphosphate pyrophosphohydrolase [Negativicutes bacterium]